MSRTRGGRSGILSPIPSRFKEVSWPGRNSAQPGGGGLITAFNTLSQDQLFPETGIDSGYSFVLQVSGLYQLFFEVSQPSYKYGSVGFNNGWSGSGGGAAWIRTTRGGSILEDNIGRQSWSDVDTNANQEYMNCGNNNRSLLAGDHVEFWTSGGATGVGPQNWNAHAIITKLRG